LANVLTDDELQKKREEARTSNFTMSKSNFDHFFKNSRFKGQFVENLMFSDFENAKTSIMFRFSDQNIYGVDFRKSEIGRSERFPQKCSFWRSRDSQMKIT
jgi:hypothetical protein